MNQLQAVKTMIVTSPLAVKDNAAYITNTIDTIGFRKARFVVLFGAMDIAVAALKLQQSDSSNMSGAADISGADFSVSPLTLPAATDDDTMYAIHVNLLGKKRYLDLSFTAGDGAVGTYAAAWVDLFDAEEAPDTAAERGMNQEAIV